MNWPKKALNLCLGLAAVVLFSAATPNSGMKFSGQPRARQQQQQSVVPPAPEREFRAMWIATVDNIDWPSKPNLSAAQQRAELVAILDRAVKLNFNAVILQVRPCCDALYNSRIEPWSEFLTGQMGRSPGFMYDPLAFAISEAHKRGLELHAWFNPYRAHKDGSAPASARHVTRTRPHLIRTYGKLQILDPSDRETRSYSLSVVMDVVRRYDIDGVHFDDYFYPYPDKNLDPRAFDAIDEKNWQQYKAQGGRLARGDWRRENVNIFIEQVYRAIKAEKPWVRFGISPFGIWRPGCPAQITGLDAYDKLYADARKWLVKGWMDYMAPQLYWSSNARGQSFPVLLRWWNEQNALHRHVWPGIAQMGEASEQVAITRANASVPGEVFWHSRSIMINSNDVVPALQKVYATPALVPPATWLNSIAPPPPVISGSRVDGIMRVNWSTLRSDVTRWVVQKRTKGKWETQIMPSRITSFQFRAPMPDAVAVSAVDRFGNASMPAVFVVR